MLIQRTLDRNNNRIGNYNSNPILDSRVYDVLLPDGSTERLAANRIAINLYSLVDNNRLSSSLMKQITGHKKLANSYEKPDGWKTYETGKRQRQIITQGWEL